MNVAAVTTAPPPSASAASSGSASGDAFATLLASVGSGTPAGAACAPLADAAEPDAPPVDPADGTAAEQAGAAPTVVPVLDRPLLLTGAPGDAGRTAGTGCPGTDQRLGGSAAVPDDPAQSAAAVDGLAPAGPGGPAVTLGGATADGAGAAGGSLATAGSPAASGASPAGTAGTAGGGTHPMAGGTARLGGGPAAAPVPATPAVPGDAAGQAAPATPPTPAASAPPAIPATPATPAVPDGGAGPATSATAGSPSASNGGSGPATPAVPATPATAAGHGSSGSGQGRREGDQPAGRGAESAGAAGAAAVTGAPTGAAAVRTPSGAEAPAPGAGTAAAQVSAEIGRYVARGDGTRRLTLRLQPEALGDVRVVLTVRHGEVQVRLDGGEAAQAALRQGAPELHRLLESAGATTTQVLIGDAASNAGGGADGRPDLLGQHTGHPADHRPARTRDGDVAPHQHVDARDGATDGTHPRPATDPTRTRSAGLDVTM